MAVPRSDSVLTKRHEIEDSCNIGTENRIEEPSMSKMTTNGGHPERTASERPLSNNQICRNLSFQIALQIQSRCYVRQTPRTDTYKTPGLMPDITGSDKETVTIGRTSGSAESDGRRDVEDPYLASDLGEERII